MSGIEPFILPTIFAGFKVCRSLLKSYKKKHASAGKDLSELDDVLRDGPNEIGEKWNPLAERQGRRFAQGDRKAIRDMNNIREVHIIYIESLLKEHINDPPPPYHPGPSPAPTGEDRPPLSPPPPNRSPPPLPHHRIAPVQVIEQQPSSSWRLEASKHARIAVQEAIRALDELHDRLSNFNPPSATKHRNSSRSSHSSHSTSPLNIPTTITSHRPVHFCPGARLLQADPALTINDIALAEDHANNHTPSYTCKFCFLEIGSFQLFTMSWDEEHWTAIARCHVMACQSFVDTMAGYVCTGCEAYGGTDLGRVRTGAVELAKHMDECLHMKAPGEVQEVRRNLGFDEGFSEDTNDHRYEMRQEQEYEHHDQRYASINEHMLGSQNQHYVDDNANASIGIGMSPSPRTRKGVSGTHPGYVQDGDPELRAPWRPMTPLGEQFVPDMPGSFRTPS